MRIEIYLIPDPTESDISGEQAKDLTEPRCEAPTLIDSDSDENDFGKYRHTLVHDTYIITFNTLKQRCYNALRGSITVSYS